MSRYVQRVSLVPFMARDVWVGWELEGVTGPLEGLLEVSALPAAKLHEIDVDEFQLIPGAYLQDLTEWFK